MDDPGRAPSFTTAAGGSEPCGNCGFPDAGLAPVHRVYLAFDERGAVTGEDEQADVERWCLPCRTSYPNRPA